MSKGTKTKSARASSARAGRRSLDWHIEPGQEAHAIVTTVLSGLNCLLDTERPFSRGATRAVGVHAGEDELLMMILAFGDAAFEDLRLLMQSLNFVNVLPREDPATGLDALYVPMGRSSAVD